MNGEELVVHKDTLAHCHSNQLKQYEEPPPTTDFSQILLKYLLILLRLVCDDGLDSDHTANSYAENEIEVEVDEEEAEDNTHIHLGVLVIHLVTTDL